MLSRYDSERIVILTAVVMAGDHAQSMLHFPIMKAILVVTIATGGLNEKVQHIVYSP